MKPNSRLINPPKYEWLLKGAAPCNYSLNSRTMYRTLVRPENLRKANQIEAFYKYDYNDFRIDWAFRSFENPKDYREYNILMVTDDGIYKEDITRGIQDHIIYMRWTVFVTKLAPRKPKLFITTKPDSREVIFFYQDRYDEPSEEDETVNIYDEEGNCYIFNKNNRLLYALKHDSDYIDVDTMNYVPVWNFRMWYLLF